jgi:hypothetical protein
MTSKAVFRRTGWLCSLTGRLQGVVEKQFQQLARMLGPDGTGRGSLTSSS